MWCPFNCYHRSHSWKLKNIYKCSLPSPYIIAENMNATTACRWCRDENRFMQSKTSGTKHKKKHTQTYLQQIKSMGRRSFSTDSEYIIFRSRQRFFLFIPIEHTLFNSIAFENWNWMLECNTPPNSGLFFEVDRIFNLCCFSHFSELYSNELSWNGVLDLCHGKWSWNIQELWLATANTLKMIKWKISNSFRKMVWSIHLTCIVHL